MGEIKPFQICYEGELTASVANAVRRLGGVPNFDQSWLITVEGERQAAPLVRWLRSSIGENARILVAAAEFSVERDFLLVRHSLSPGSDYTELQSALSRLGTVYDLPFESAFVIRSDDRTDVQTLGAALCELCPDDSLMVMGITVDWAYCNSGASRIRHYAAARREADFSRLRTRPGVVRGR